MKLRALTVILLLMMLFSVECCAINNGLWEYTSSSDGITIERYLGAEKTKKIEFPSEIDGRPVKTIGRETVLDVVYLCIVGQRTELVFPEGIETINGSFFTLGSFGKVVIPSTVKRIGTGAFQIAGPSKFEFKGAPEKYGRYAFSQNDQIKEITINEGALSMGEGCFKDCKRLTKVSLPSTLEEIGMQMFSGCTRLEKVTFADGCAIKIIPKATFLQSGIKSIVLPNGLERILENAFYGCEKLTSVTIPSSVIKIWDNAFDGCSSKLTLIVEEGSYAEQWAMEKGIKTKHPSTNTKKKK